ncbi:MAG: hypothetical protein GDA48_01650 [Hormoscilla sp. GM102CHS1]|nr:hypothetical protein [Hormoscilla sp. GM102CHS1]
MEKTFDDERKEQDFLLQRGPYPLRYRSHSHSMLLWSATVQERDPLLYLDRAIAPKHSTDRCSYPGNFSTGDNTGEGTFHKLYFSLSALSF